MLSAYDTNTLPSTLTIEGTTMHSKRPQVFVYASQVYYRRDEDGAVFSAHIDDLDDPDLDIKACREGVVVPSGASPYDPSDADNDDVLGEWLDRCDEVEG